MTRTVVGGLLLLAFLAAPGGLFAQPESVPPSRRAREQAPAQVVGGPQVSQDLQQSAETTRQQLQNLLWQLPPSLRTVLQADPSLAERHDYLAPYPALLAFLQEHPEVSRNAAFFFGSPEYNRRGPEPLDVFAAILAGTGLFIGFMTVMVIIGSILRQVVDYRRWVRQSRMQAEVHTKILDRLQTNEDLLAYVQTPAGRHFLEFTPVSAESEPRPAGAPLGRILWSVQAGVVLAALGLGLRFARGNVPEEIIPAFTVLGVIVMSLGIGAVVSAAIAYVLSARLGLLPAPRQST